MKASLRTCTACHDEGEVAELETYHANLKEAISKLDGVIERVRNGIAAADLDAERKTAVDSQLDDIAHDVHFLRAGNDIHNMHYARALAEAFVEQLTSLCGELKVEGPDLKLPDRHVTQP